mmetsp:Transcript_2771/g.9369  ORF Transcript_2771/g.9369 Transcript_2771/m.9369 type:complete len:209 (+) Transcript_2771:1104-1730(+)
MVRPQRVPQQHLAGAHARGRGRERGGAADQVPHRHLHERHPLRGLRLERLVRAQGGDRGQADRDHQDEAEQLQEQLRARAPRRVLRRGELGGEDHVPGHRPRRLGGGRLLAPGQRGGPQRLHWGAHVLPLQRLARVQGQVAPVGGAPARRPERGREEQVPRDDLHERHPLRQHGRGRQGGPQGRQRRLPAPGAKQQRRQLRAQPAGRL